MRRCWVVTVLLAGLACENFPPPVAPPGPASGTLDQQLRAAIGIWGPMPIGPMPQQPRALVELGQALFFDKVLSGNRDVSCATCHEPALTAGDGMALSVGTGGQGQAPDRTLGTGRVFVPRNAPTLLNIGLGPNYMFWDGRVNGHPQGGQFASPAGIDLPAGLPSVLAAQAMFPVLNRHEMRGQPGDLDVFGNPNDLAGLSDDHPQLIWDAVIWRLINIPEYVALFQAAFPGTPTQSLTFGHAAIAIATFERAAMSFTNSPFDRYLARDDGALTTQEKRGALLFFGGEARCASCHSGAFLGGNGFANVGVPQLGPGSGDAAPLDKGAGETFGFEFYDFAFRVAPLRNVELTAPYMHNGAYATLEAVVDHYSNVALALRQYDASQLPPALRGSVHGDAATITLLLSKLDERVPDPGDLDATEQQELVAFLRALTDPAARNLAALSPVRVPSGLPIR